MKTLHHFNKNQKGDDYVVGDIHGMYDVLMGELKKIGFDKSCDRLFSVGDLIDRGPDSIKCLALCYEPWFFPVRGNHEEMAFDCILGYSDGGMWIQNGGAWYLGEECDELNGTFHDLSERLPHGIEVETDSGLVGVVHADVMRPKWKDNFNGETEALVYMLWSRSRVMGHCNYVIEGIDRLYVGHSVLSAPEVIDNVHYIDIGCGYKDKIYIEKIS